VSRSLSVSNLAWGIEFNRPALELLAALGVAGVEVAPTRIADWANLTVARLKAYCRDLASVGLRTSSLQAIFFNRPGAQLLGDQEAFEVMLEHTRRVAEIAQILDAKVGVFGAPRNRSSALLSNSEASKRAVDRLRQLGEAAASGGMVLGIEPVPTQYGGDFLMHARDVIGMVEMVAHPSIRVHLDTACVMMGGDEIDEAIYEARSMLVHFHVAEPMLDAFSSPRASHNAAATALFETHYDRWIAIEMKEQAVMPLEAVETAVRFVQKTYFGSN